MSVDYESHSVINALSSEIQIPCFLAVIGLNGSGKSTFIKALCEKIPYTGEINKPATFAYLGQKNNLSFNISVQEMLLMGRFRHKHFTQNYDQEDLTTVLNFLTDLKLQHLWGKQFSELSGGEQQLLWIVQTLLQEMDVVVLDEPTQQLDLRNKKKVFRLLNDQVEQFGKTIICVTHDLHNLTELSNGYVLNFSKKNPVIERISSETIKAHIQFMESLDL